MTTTRITLDLTERQIEVLTGILYREAQTDEGIPTWLSESSGKKGKR